MREVGGRIPWIADRHCSNGVACILLPEDRWWSFQPSRPFAEYLRGPLHNYLLGQTVFDQTGKWPFGEHAHGWAGVAGFYQEKFGTEDADVVIGGLKLIAGGKVRGHWPCPCKSEKVIRDCHPGIIEAAKKMPPWAARKSLDALTRSVQSDSSKTIHTSAPLTA